MSKIMSTEKTIHIAVTGGAGQIAYQLLFRIANGDLFGTEQPIALHILEVPSALQSLQGVVMELQDSAFPLLHQVSMGSDPDEVFQGVDYALLIGSKPRGPGMKRKDLLKENSKIFVEQGKSLHKVASKEAKVFVVGNPCNTNCLIAMNQGRRIPRENFHAMTRLDQNRATFQLSQKAGVLVEEVSHMTIWGNHSLTQVPDFFHARIGGQKVENVISDSVWLQTEFIEKIQKRGAEIIQARGKSSAASAASALIDAVRAITQPTEEKMGWFSSAICSDGNPYGIEENLIFSFPCISTGRGEGKIVSALDWPDFLEKKIRESERELIEERECIRDFI